MAIQLTLATNGFLTFPAGTAVSGGGPSVVESFGTISELTDAALTVKFPEIDDAQPGDLLWVGEGRNLVAYRMIQGADNAQIAASWGPASTGSDLLHVAAVGHLLEVEAFPSAGVNGVVQEPLRSRPEITGLTAANPWTPEDAPYLVRDAANIWHIGRFELAFPAFGLDGVLFRPPGYEITSRSLVWDDNENQLWVLEPIGEGGQAYLTGGGDPSETVQTFGQIAELTDTALAARFVAADEAQPDDLIWVVVPASSTAYRMNADALDARLAASWTTFTPQSVASSGALNAGGIVQSPLRDRPELAALTGFQNTQETYLVQQTPGDDSSWAVGRFSQFGTTLDDLFFRTTDLEITAPTVILVEDSQEIWLVNPDGSRAAVTVHPDITTLSDEQLGGAFAAADSANPGDLIYARREAEQSRYRMNQGATDARLAASWSEDAAAPSGPVAAITDTVYDSSSSSTNPLAHAAIAGQFNAIAAEAVYNALSTSDRPLSHRAIADKFNALVVTSENEPNVSESEWIIWVQRSADGRSIEAFLRVSPSQYMTIGRIVSPTPST